MSKGKRVTATHERRMEENKGERKTKYNLQSIEDGSSCWLLAL
jgi:hypothetical protein